MNSVWSDTMTMPSYPPLDGNTKTDVLIIGGGMAGVLCAYRLKQKGIDHLLVEGATIGSGITKGTTAVISAQHDTPYSALIEQSGEQNARRYLHTNLRAVADFRELCQQIDCDFEDKPSYVYSLDTAKMEAEVGAVNRLGFGAELATETALPFSIGAAVKFPSMAQFHPLKFIGELSKQLSICEHTYVHKIEGTTAYTNKGEIRAEHIIITTHFPFINHHGLYFTKLYQQRSYVIALEQAKDIGGTYVHDVENGLYFRNYKDLLLIGGGDHRTGKQGGNFEVLRQFAKRHFPDAHEKYAWATQDCISLDGIPYIGQYSKALPGVLVATGFNEWGMTSSMVSAHILSDIVCGDQNESAPVFSPQRSMLHKQLFVNFGETLVNLALPVTKRCSHLGCALHWNKTEHTWDCPCHGSRFDETGRLIDNPAMRDSHV